MFNSNSIKFRSASGGTRLVSSTLIRILAVVMAFLVIVDATQAGILISGQDHRDLGDVNSLKAFNTQTGGLLWQVAAGNAKAGEFDPIAGDLVVASGGANLGVTDDVRRYDVQTGAVIGNNPLYNHDIGNAPGIAIDPINGDIYHTAASSPPGHNGLRLFASNGGNQADFLGGVDGFPQVLSSAWDLQWFESPSENLLFVLNSVQRSPKALLFNGVSFSFSGHYQSAPTGPATRQMTINPNNNKIYATDQEYRVYEWNPSDSTSPTKEVLFDDTNLQAASGLAFDELNNLYVTEEGPGSPNVGEVQIYKYTPNAGGTWEFDSVLATIEENVGIGNPGQWLQYVDAVPVCAGSCPGDLADGDFDASGLVDLEDLNFVLFNWNELGENLSAEWTHMRPDQGDAVSLVELNKVLFTWNQSGPSTVAVPEPTALCLLVIGLVALVAGQRGAC